MTAYLLFVNGLPAPQGSKTVMPNGAVLEGKTKGQRQRHKAWRQAVAARANVIRAGRAPITGPVRIEIEFGMPMPKSRPAADRKRGWKWHTVSPDIDKLVRSTLDGLTDGGLIKDDKYVCQLDAYAVETVTCPGARIVIRQLKQDDET